MAGFDQIIEGARLEGLQGIIVVAGHKDDDGHLRKLDLGNHLETVHLGHLDIKKYQIGCQPVDGFDGLRAVGSRANDFNVRFVTEHVPQHRQPG